MQHYNAQRFSHQLNKYPNITISSSSSSASFTCPRVRYHSRQPWLSRRPPGVSEPASFNPPLCACVSISLQQDREAECSSSHDSQGPECLSSAESPDFDSLTSSARASTPSSCAACSCQPRVESHRTSRTIRRHPPCSCTARSTRSSTHRPAQSGRILPRRVESSTRVVLSARGGTGRIASAIRHALGSPFGANEVGEGLRVLGYVGREAVVADAGVGE